MPCLRAVAYASSFSTFGPSARVRACMGYKPVLQATLSLIIRRPDADHPQLEEVDDLLLGQLVGIEVINDLAHARRGAAGHERVDVFDRAGETGNGIIDREEGVFLAHVRERS